MTLQEELALRAKALTDEQAKAILQLLNEFVQPVIPPDNPEYDESRDPAIGLFSGPTDLSVRAKELLREEIDLRSGWTQKDKL